MTPCSPLCGFRASRVYVQNVPVCTRHHAHMFQHMCARCRHTRDVLNVHTEAFLKPNMGFTKFFQRAAHTQTQNTHHDHQQHHDHNDTHHNITRRQRETEKERQRKKTEKERQRKEGQRKRDKTREDKRRRHKSRRQEKMKEE